jgi:hypothetical protein
MFHYGHLSKIISDVIIIIFCFLLLLVQIINQKLYQVVREEKQLTYDASFQLHSSGQKSLRPMDANGGATNWYSIAVTAAADSPKV